MRNMNEEKVRGRKALPELPCGCPSRTGQGHTDSVLLGDGSRVCKEHGKRWVLSWTEIKENVA